MNWRYLFFEKLLNKLYLTFFFSPFRFKFEIIDTKMYLHGF